MVPQRRSFIQLAGLSVTGALAGCLGLSESWPDREPPSGIVAAESHPFAVRSDRPSWGEGNEIGRVVLIDAEERAHEVFQSYDLPEERAESIEAFTAEMAYDEERLLFVESTGANACHDHLDVTNVRLADDELRADAAVVDSREGQTGCAEVITYPSTLVRVSFEDTPADSASVEVTDGWGETATLSSIKPESAER